MESTEPRPRCLTHHEKAFVEQSREGLEDVILSLEMVFHIAFQSPKIYVCENWCFSRLRTTNHGDCNDPKRVTAISTDSDIDNSCAI